MDFTVSGLLNLARDSVTDPRGVARRIMGLGLPAQVGWMALGLMAVASALLTHLSLALSPPAAQEFFGDAMASPLRTAVLQGLVMVISVHLIHRIGALRGGIGGLTETILLVAWVQFLLLLVQMVQMAALVLLPPLSDLLGLLGLALFFWLLSNFVAELHGFQSVPKTFLGVLAVMVLAGFVLAIILATLFGAPATGV
ncbi:YIP1 family protein [Szabonella alba]|uniref:YIP1 family protein n=1 Tax=Szabonella alba TaxID=2804194 RepID=A0A8K0XZ24_9RHOB|nr:YIP1 family protein [Szabonella alba]MBL4916351.1 YIP1 family protein [Szabonella alba]